MPTVSTRTQLIDDLFTVTWDDVSREVVDQAFQVTPFWSTMVEKGRIKEKMPEGNYWEVPIRYAKQDQNTKWFGRGSTFGKAEKESLTRLRFQARNLGTSVVRFWDDDRKNRGQAQLIDYVEEKVNNTKDSLVDSLETDAFVQNSDSLSMTSLSTLIATAPTTGTVGEVDRSTFEELRNNASDFTGKTVDTDLLATMTTMFNDCSKWKAGTRRAPDIIITTQSIYESYEGIARALQMISTSDSIQASLGFGDLKFKGVPIFWSPECEAGKMYFLNTEHLTVFVDPANYFTMTEWKSAQDSLDRVAQIVAVMQIGCDNFRKQGVIFNIA